MKIVAIAAAALLLTACNSLPGTGGSNFDINAFLNSTTCAHKDSVSGVTGAAGIPASLQFSASRDCPAVGAVTPSVITPPTTSSAPVG